MRSGLLVQILGGLALGLALGLLIAWIVAPVEYTDTSPSSLRAEFKDQYRAAIASAFNATGNLDRAVARLSLMGDANPQQALVDQAQRMIASGGSPDSAFEIAVLVNALDKVFQASITETAPVAASTRPSGQDNQPTPTQTPFGLVSTPKASSTPGSSPTPRSTATSRPTATITPTVGAPFVVAAREESCNPDQLPGLLMVEVRNKKRQPVPGQELVISWSGGQESFFTGLKPEINDGYADYQMQPNVVYSLHLTDGSETVIGLTAPVCANNAGEEYPGGIKIIFQQP